MHLVQGTVVETNRTPLEGDTSSTGGGEKGWCCGDVLRPSNKLFTVLLKYSKSSNAGRTFRFAVWFRGASRAAEVDGRKSTM